MNCGKGKILFTEIVVSYTLVVTQAHPYLSHQPTNLPFPFNSMLFHYLLPLLIAEYAEQFYAIIYTLFSYFQLLFCYPYIC